MRSSLGRLTLRGARAVASTSTRKPALYRPPQLSRDLCTSTAISSEAKRKPETETDAKEEHISVVDILKNEPAVEVLNNDSASPEVIAKPLGADVEANEKVEEAPATNSEDPKGLHIRLSELLNRNSTRSALWEYGNALNEEGSPSIDADVMKLILPVLARNSWSTTASDTIALAMERGYVLSTGILNCGLHAMSRSGKADEVASVMQRMWTYPPQSHPNATSFNYLIGAHIYRGDVDEAFEVLNEMKKYLIYPTFATYHALITGCLRRRDPRRAYQTLIAVEKQRFDISAMTIAQVMVASADNDDYDHVLHLLTKFEECLPRYGAELHRIAEFRGPYKINTVERTSKGDREELRGDPKPEIGALSTVLHCAFRGGRADLASRVWMLMEEYYPTFEPPAPFWYCLIGAYAGAGEFAQAIDFIGLMREKGLSINMKDLDISLIRPLAYDVTLIDEQFYRLCDRIDGKEGGNGPGTHAVVAQSEETSAEDTAPVLSDGADGEAAAEDTAAKDLSVGASLKDANSDMDKADTDDKAAEGVESLSLAEALLTPSTHTGGEFSLARQKPQSVGIEELNCIVAACSAAQDLDRAFQTYDEIGTRFKVQRNIDTYNALLEGCVQTRRLAGGLRVLEEIQNLGLPVSGQTLHLACRLMLRSGRSDEVDKLLTEAHRKGDNISVQTYQMVLRHFCRGDKLETAVKFLKWGEEAGISRFALTGRFDYNTAQKIKEYAYGTDGEAREEPELSVDEVAESSSVDDASEVSSQDSFAEGEGEKL